MKTVVIMLEIDNLSLTLPSSMPYIEVSCYVHWEAPLFRSEDAVLSYRGGSNCLQMRKMAACKTAMIIHGIPWFLLHSSAKDRTPP